MGETSYRPLRYSAAAEPSTSCLCLPNSGQSGLCCGCRVCIPPVALIRAVLNKIQTSNCRIDLIAPYWSAQSWFPDLLNLLEDHPRKIPASWWPTLLVQPRSGILHFDPERLKLHIWRLSRDTHNREGFL